MTVKRTYVCDFCHRSEMSDQLPDGWITMTMYYSFGAIEDYNKCNQCGCILMTNEGRVYVPTIKELIE